MVGLMLPVACLHAQMESISILKEQALAAAGSACPQKIKQLSNLPMTALTGSTTTDLPSMFLSESFHALSQRLLEVPTDIKS